MNICPCCKRAIRAPKPAVSKLLTQDIERAEKAIAALHKAKEWPGENRSFRDACDLEIKRLYMALGDNALLWSIYGRGRKASQSYVVAPVVEAAA